MGSENLDIENKIDILKFVFQDQRREMQYRREREYRIFTWSTSILSALIGALLITKQTGPIIWQPFGIWGNMVASAAIILIMVYSALWQFRNNRFRGQNAQVISRINTLLHCFEKGYFDKSDQALFPEEWTAYGRNRAKSSFQKALKRIFAVNYTSATVILGILALIMVWLPQ
jgi:carbon starvation protein CstA